MRDKKVIAENLIKYGHVEKMWNANRTKILKFQQEIWHDGLKDHKVITAPEIDILKNKVKMQVDKWREKWNVVLEKKRIEEIKNTKTEEAIKRTKEAEEKLSEIEDILLSTLKVSHVIEWEQLKIKGEFTETYPVKPSEPDYDIIPVAPDKSATEFQPKLNIFTGMFRFLEKKAIAEAEQIYKEAYNKWQIIYDEKTQFNDKLKADYQKSMGNFTAKVDEWSKKKEEYVAKQNEVNSKIDRLKLHYLSYDISAILEYCEMVLNNSVLPDIFQKDFQLDYNPDTKILIIEYMLPSIESFPRLKEVKYISSKDEMKESYHNDSYIERLFDTTVYRLILRVLHEEFEVDVINAIDAIQFNGWINYLNKATGNREDVCIVSIQVKKEDFKVIDLKNVDPKACFKNLKGIGSSKLAGITPVKPILTLDKNDKRFVESYDVAHLIDDSTNLAAIPWEDFEHLIRQLFEDEFSGNGGEVKVTQASRDGGVDAVAFDPDPIRGGKIVIQAKRYTNTVGVSAVRDLFGTLINEGATKGILVTTADYGPDAYEFANNKPITLLNGGNLLYLLEKHGHKAKIDLKEAKILNANI